MTTSLPFITECTRLLLAGGADIHAVDMGGNNVLHYASAGDNFSFLQASSSAPLLLWDDYNSGVYISL